MTQIAQLRILDEMTVSRELDLVSELFHRINWDRLLLSISLTPSKYLARSISIRCLHASARLPSTLNQHKMKPLRPRAILGGVILLIVQNISEQCGPWLLWMM
jgi:hypothetical protein